MARFTKPNDMGTISKDFSFSEFERSKIAEKKGICNVVRSFAVRDAIKSLVDNVLQPLRDIAGVPLRINSGYRCSELNAAVGGVPTSQHVKGEAADVAFPKPIELAKMAADNHLPFDQMIIYPTFVHFSHKLNGEQRRQIIYNKSYTDEKL